MRFTRLISSFAAIGALTMLVVAGCSSDDKKTDASGGDDGGGAAGKTSTTKGGAAGAATTGTAGKTTTTTTTPTAGNAGAATTTTAVAGATATGAGGSAGTATTGSGGTTSAGASGSGAGGTTATGSTLDDLIGAICNWEFKCCDPGEAKWELGPLVTTAAACKEKFVYLLRNDTAASSPYPATDSLAMGKGGLLLNLAYQLSMDRVTENPTGIAACIAQWNAQACRAAIDPKAALTHCTATSAGVVNPCDLTNLVKPKLAANQICNFQLTEGASNDVECVSGTTCLDSSNPDNPNKSYPTCVTRGVAGTTCTYDKDCDFNFYCGSAGKCVEKGGPGATCAFKTPAAPKPEALAAPCKPGLSCNPNTLKCVENCKLDYICNSTSADAGNDYACPAGASCVPITVVNDSASFKACTAVGAAGADCNSQEDCAANNYCAGTKCAVQKGENEVCSTSVSGNCVAGMYCKEGATPGAGICAPFVKAGVACTRAPGATSVADISCDPAKTIGCVHKGEATADTYICSATLLPDASRCSDDVDCVSGRCERASATSTYKTCIAGAKAGEVCDSILISATDGKTRCGPGLTCDLGTTKCVVQAGPGGACTNSTGTADPTLCKNAACNSTQWADVAGGGTMCTDAAVTPFNGGTGVVCDGK